MIPGVFQCINLINFQKNFEVLFQQFAQLHVEKIGEGAANFHLKGEKVVDVKNQSSKYYKNLLRLCKKNEMMFMA